MQKKVSGEQTFHLPLETPAHRGQCFPTAWEMSAPCVLSYNYRGDTTDAPSSDPSFGVLIWRKQKAVFFASGQVIGTIAPAHLWGLDWQRLEPHGLTIGYLARMVPPGRAARGPSKEVQRGGLPTSRNQEHEPMLIITRFVRATRAEGGKHVNR